MICEKCGILFNDIYGSGRFCSSKCARSFATSKNRIEINLKVSNTLSGRKTTGKHKFTSEFIKEKWKDPSFAKKVSDGIRESNRVKSENRMKLPIEFWTRDERRKYLLEQSNYSCSVCGYKKVHPTTGKPPLEIHHIDGDKKNNVRENLMVVCLNCHFMVDEKYRFRGRSKKV